jgi:hypothetical protein
MEQRPLRLGDILDDYCPRERRVTNHAVVALIEQDVKQTRCTTCDTEHVYKGGRAPRRKKPESTGALYKEVLAGITDADAAPAALAAVSSAHPDEVRDIEEPAPAAPAIAADTEKDAPEQEEPQPEVEEGPVHRPLIRAQLARPEGIKIERQAPEFTIRQNSGRGGGNGSFRGGGGSGGGDMRARGGGGRPGGGGGGTGASNNNGHRFGRGPQRTGGRGAGPAQGFGRGPGAGSGGGGQQRSGRPPKRSR